MPYLSRKLTDAIPPRSLPTPSVSCQGYLASATLMISISSTRMRFPPPLQGIVCWSFLRYLEALTGILSLGMTKLANTLYASELQRRLTAIGSRIIVISLHPGGVYTYFNRPSIPYCHFIFKPIISLFFSHPDKGAYNSVFAAASEDVIKEREKYRGAYLMPVGRVSKPTKVARDEELAKELMNSVDAFLQERGM
jgi:hypothetical protein